MWTVPLETDIRSTSPFVRKQPDPDIIFPMCRMKAGSNSDIVLQ